MTKQQLWSNVYIEAMRQSRMNSPKELADKAVDEFESRFGKLDKILNSGNKVTFTPFDIPKPPPDRLIREGEEPPNPYKYDPDCGCDKCDSVE